MLSTLRTTTARSVGGSSLRAVGVAPTLARGHAGCSGHHHPPPPEATTKPAAAEKKELPHRSSGTPLNVPTTQGGPSDADAYCASLVQRLDPDAWLQSYFWPRREKAWWLAIRAFNLELHQVSTTVSQPAIAAMRFQFWRDALAQIWAGNPPQHPVAIALAEAHRYRPIQKYYLNRLIETRAKNLSAPPASADMDAYLATHAPIPDALLQTGLTLVVPPTAPETSKLAHTLSHVANTLSVVSLLRQLPSAIGKQQNPLPSAICANNGLSDEDLFRDPSGKKVRDAVFEVATRGMDEMITARRDLKDWSGAVKPSAAMPVFLAAVPAERWLKRLEEVDFDVTSKKMARHDWRLAPAIWARYLRGKL